jgi:sarcosine oxidase, subunit alpha
MKRLAPQPNEWIDRSKPIGFSFEGQTFSGYAGDTLTSALTAAGVRTLGRSFKYHRRRGVLSAANHDVNAIVQLGAQHGNLPNVRADVWPIAEGMEARAVNTAGGLAKDRRAQIERLAAFLPVGFYYKAFHSKRLFPRWERMFRDMTGLGAVDLHAPRRVSAKRYAFADVAVIGAGPSGLAAALAAADAGAEVWLIDENAHIGGSGGYALGSDPVAAARAAEGVQAAVAHGRITAMTRTVAAGYYADHWLALDSVDRLIKLRARSVVIAQGAFEQPAVFRNNDLPGIMLASGAQRLMRRYAAAPASRIAVLGANTHAYRAALDALDAGIDVALVIEMRETLDAESEALASALHDRGVRTTRRAAIYAARADARGELAAIELARDYHGEWQAVKDKSIAVDGVWMSTGFAPANALLLQAGAKMRFDARLQQYVPSELPAGVFACGKVNGAYAFNDRLADGARAGSAAAVYCGGNVTATGAVSAEFRETPNFGSAIVSHPRGRNFVDFDEDLQLKDFAGAVQEGFDSPELMKRFTTVGMGPSQGKHSNLNALRVLATLRGTDIEALGTTTSRPMFHPVPMAHLAGRGFTPERRTPMDTEHQALGAVWMPAGNWRRPEYYRRAEQSRLECIAAEVHAVRNGVGLIDVGTLGKIEVHGSAAGQFLERVYTGRFENLKAGMTRYGLMLDESGVIIDDGVIARLAAEVFYFTTTTGNSATIYRELGRLATWWSLPVGLVNLTGHLTAMNLAGPRSRELLQSLTPLDLSNAAFPYLGVRETAIAGVAARLLRVGFVGELGYEIHVPAGSGLAVWRALMAAGSRLGIMPFGVEAQRLLRLEKAHVIVGQDTDGLTNPLEIGAEWAVKMDKPFFIGQRSLAIIARQPRKQQLVGFAFAPGERPQVKECHLVIKGGELAGRVTSVGISATLERTIGLALVTPAVAQEGNLMIRGEGGVEVRASILPLPFYDAAGARQKLGAPP